MREPATIRQHWNNVGQLRCMVSDSPIITLHHCHGGSMSGRWVTRGGSQKTSDWLVIPLHPAFHTGTYGIDGSMGVGTWEMRFGMQSLHLDDLCVLLGYDVWRLYMMHETEVA